MGENLKHYLDNEVSWEVVTVQYGEAYLMAGRSARTGQPVILDPEF